jgi:hypothetical protein
MMLIRIIGYLVLYYGRGYVVLGAQQHIPRDLDTGRSKSFFRGNECGKNVRKSAQLN